MLYYLFIFASFFALCGLEGALPNEEPIVVQLAGESVLLPIYVSPIEANKSELSADFQKSLEAILIFDLNHNGMTKALNKKEAASFASLKGQEAFDAPVDFQKLKEDQILYLIKLQIKGRELTAKILSISSQTKHIINNILLSGNLSQDRVKMHRLADAIHKILFGKEGIASCRILFTGKKKIVLPSGSKWVSEVFESDYDGENCRQITATNSYCAHPVYIPAKNGLKSNSFLYVSYKIGQPKIYLSSLKDGREVRASGIRGNQVTPSIDKESSLIAFACDVTGKSDLFIQSLTSHVGAVEKPRQIFTAKASANASPSFSPNGKQIAFVSNKDGSPKIYVIDIPKPGTKLEDVKTTLISKRCRENSAPTWSPDGKKIAYCSRSTGPRQIWVYDFETGTERQLTQGSATKENPAWAPDSLHLLFNGSDAKGTELYLINLNQPNAVQISSGPNQKLFASWEPKNL